MIKGLTILQKGLILIAVPLLFQLGFIGVVSSIRGTATIAESWTIHTKDVIILSETCRGRLLSAHGSVQGYILTNDPSYDAELVRLDQLIRDRLLELRELVRDNPAQQNAADEIRSSAIRFLTFMNEGAGMVRKGEMNASKAATRRQNSQRSYEAINQAFDHFLAEERRLQSIRDARLEQSWRRLDALLVGGSIVSILSSVLVATLFARNISGRITILTDNAFRVADGRELNSPIGGLDEIARLDEVFHEMTDVLTETRDREQVHAELLERRAEELAAVNNLLREKATENEMFVYSVSHDLRSPLVNLQGFSKELSLIGKDLTRLIDRDEVPSDTRKQARALIDVEMAESIGFIQSAVIRLSGIIDALLRLSRAGRIEYRRVEVDAETIIARVVSALRGTMEERGATVTVGKLPPVYCDPTAFEQIFANLIGNAVNYLDARRPGRIEVFAVEPGQVEGLTPPGYWTYAVVDNGLGISDSYKDKVFTAFQRLHGDVAKGEGIGLALVRRVVERLGGKVWFESKVGEGSTFYVSLPSTDPGATRVEVDATMGPSSAPNQKDAAWPVSP